MGKSIVSCDFPLNQSIDTMEPPPYPRSPVAPVRGVVRVLSSALRAVTSARARVRDERVECGNQTL